MSSPDYLAITTHAEQHTETSARSNCHWGVFLPQLYTLYKGVTDRTRNPFADLSVEGRARGARYRYIA